MHRHDGANDRAGGRNEASLRVLAAAFLEKFAESARVEIECVGVDVDEDGFGADAVDARPAVAKNVKGCVMTASPGPMPSAMRMASSASVPRRHADGMFATEVVGDGFFEILHGRAEHEVLALEARLTRSSTAALEAAFERAKSSNGTRTARTLDDAEFRPAILCPCFLATSGIGRHFLAEAHGLDLAGVDTRVDQRLAHGEGAALSEAAIVLVGSAIVRETGDDERLARRAHRRGDFAHLRALTSGNFKAVVAEINRRELAAVHVAAEEIHAIHAIGKRRAGDEISAVNARVNVSFFLQAPNVMASAAANPRVNSLFMRKSNTGFRSKDQTQCDQ